MATDDNDSQSIEPSALQTVHREPSERDYCDVCLLGQSSAKNGYLVNIRVVERSAKGGCRACAGIQQFVKTLPVGEAVKGIHFFPILELGSPDYDSRPYFVVYCKDRKFDCEFFSASGLPAGQQLNSFNKPSSFHPMIQPMTIPSGDTSSVEAFRTLTRWISRCHAEHGLCEFTGEMTLPHRLLEIESLQPLRVRVVENCPRPGKYACLSHRWAEPETKSKSLTMENLALYKAGIPEDRFYTLVRDAITAVFRLNLRFIWIDCFCIIQDDDEDWEKEAANMASIYEHAFLTISATSSENGCSMFSAISPDSLGIKVTEINGEAVFARKRLMHPCDALTYFEEEDLSGTLLTRAWVFQERLLSRRFIHFTEDEIFWECRECTWCECASRGQNWQHRRAKAARLLQSQKWEDIAMQYNQTQLSFEKDRIPAFAGVAKRYGEEHGKTYLAGLWREDLPGSLAWSKYIRKDDPGLRPLRQTAPTWSWLSLPRGQLSLEHNTTTTSVRLLNCVRKPAGADIYAGANRTEITVEGPVLDLRIFPYHEQSGRRGIVGRTDDAFLTMCADFNLNPKDRTKYRAVPFGTSCSLLILSKDEDRPGQEQCFGILLAQATSTDSNGAVFERIGFFDHMNLYGSHLVESGKFGDYRGGQFPSDVYKGPKVSVAWLLQNAERRKVTII